MKNSVTTWLDRTELLSVEFEEDGDMVTLYLGPQLEIYMHKNELKHLAKQANQFLEEKDHVVSKR